MNSKFAPGFYSQEQELQYNNLEIEGKFPEWLSGSLLRTGPALYELEHQNYRHWYDGLAMLYKFSFQNGKVDFASKFLESKSYLKARNSGKVEIKEWATDPCRSVFEQLKSYLIAPALTDNGNINIIAYGDMLLATSETPLPIEFDRETLKTFDQADFNDSLQGQIDPSHPHYDKAGNVYSYLLKYSLISKYQIYRLNPKTMQRDKITEIKIKNPSYMHSFGFTENYLVLVEFPFVVNPVEMKFGDKPLIENYKWKPELGTKYQVINLHNGEVNTFEGDPIFAFHHVNAYEEGDQIHLDMITFADTKVIKTLYLEDLRGNDPTYAAGHLTRATINKTGSSKAVTLTRLSEKLMELPRINYKSKNGKNYRYTWGAGNTKEGNWLDDITKIDVKTGEHKTWYEKHCYPGEPVFIEHPDAKNEDDGVLLSVVLDSDAKDTFLLVLDASTLSVLAKARFPEVIPFSFHGNFYN